MEQNRLKIARNLNCKPHFSQTYHWRLVSFTLTKSQSHLITALGLKGWSDPSGILILHVLSCFGITFYSTYVWTFQWPDIYNICHITDMICNKVKNKFKKIPKCIKNLTTCVQQLHLPSVLHWHWQISRWLLRLNIENWTPVSACLVHVLHITTMLPTPTRTSDAVC